MSQKQEAPKESLSLVEVCLLRAQIRTITAKIKTVTKRMPAEYREKLFVTYVDLLKLNKEFTEKYLDQTGDAIKGA